MAVQEKLEALDTPLEKEIFNSFLSKIYLHNLHNLRNKKKNLDNILGVLYIHEKIEATEGGSCWDEDEHNNYEVYVSEKEIMSNLLFEIKRFAQLDNLEQVSIDTWAENYIQSKSKHSYVTEYIEPEYYGNSTTYGIYKVNLNELIKKICSNEQKVIYQEVIRDFTPPQANKNSMRY